MGCLTSAVEMSAVAPALDSQLDADVDSSDSNATPTVGSTPPPSSDLRDNQLDELASQPLLPSLALSGADFDSLQGATVTSACFDSPVPPPSPGKGPSSSTSNVGLLGKKVILVEMAIILLVILVMERGIAIWKLLLVRM